MIQGDHTFVKKHTTGGHMNEVCPACGITLKSYNRLGVTCQDQQELNARGEGRKRRRDGSHY